MENRPLADLVRPESLDDVFGQSHLLKKTATFRKVIESGKVPNMIFYGNPGIGKTTVAKIISKNAKMSLFTINGTTANIDDIKSIINESKSILNSNGVLLYLDEIQYLNKKQQQSLLEYVEAGSITLIASTTENPYFYIYPALLSRCMVFEFKPLTVDEISLGLNKVCKKVGLKITKDAVNKIALASNGDMRKAINYVEFAGNSTTNITLNVVDDFINKANISYDRNQDHHYDNLSAFMKSLRGSDSDAALFYLAKLLDGGDLIAASRRLLCSASEDVGLAYPQIVTIVKSCVDSALQLGMPEAQLPLSVATISICNAPKSNSACLAIGRALEDVRAGKGTTVPRSLQNTHFDGDDAKFKGQNYKYPHEYGHHWVKQQYLPDDIKDAKYYIPGDNKNEQSYKDYWDKIKK